MHKSKVISIVGPTSSGKSALAVRLAKKFGAEIISADSRQVYRGLDVGTGKITPREMRGVPHHLLDVASPKRIFTAADFVRIAERACSRVLQKTRVPIIVGGTGFYIDALLGRATLPDVPPNRKLRTRLANKTVVELCAMLKRRDPHRAKVMNESDRKNPRRLIRALEITIAKTKVGPSSRPSSTKVGALYETLWIGVTWPKVELKRRIHARLRARMRRGMVAEARHLYACGLSYKRMKALGLEYRSLARFLQNKISRDELLLELERDIFHYAKRQLTYWRRNTDIQWFSPKDTGKIFQAVRAFLSR